MNIWFIQSVIFKRIFFKNCDSVMKFCIVYIIEIDRNIAQLKAIY